MLALPLGDAGFDSTLLGAFRLRVVVGGAEQMLLDAVLDTAVAKRLVCAGGRQRTDSTHVLAAVRALNRAACMIETMRHALEALAVAAPDWLMAHMLPDWSERHENRSLDWHLPKSAAKRDALVQTVGIDGHLLLGSAFASDAPDWLRQLPAIEMLRRVWVQQFHLTDDEVRWRTSDDGIPPLALFISSPHDLEADYARKRTTSWIGYTAHLTETCDDDVSRRITHVQTMAAPVLR